MSLMQVENFVQQFGGMVRREAKVGQVFFGRSVFGLVIVANLGLHQI